MSIVETNPSEELNLRLQWPAICGLACKAMILGLTFEEIVERAVTERLAREPKRHG